MTNSIDSREIRKHLLGEAQKLFGAERTSELQAEIEIMADQLAVLRTTPVDLQDEP